MKTALATLTLALALSTPLKVVAAESSGAASLSVKPTEFYRSQEMQIDLFGSAITPDLDNYETGAGVGVNFFLSRNFGLGVTAAGNWSENGRIVDQIGLSGIYRIPIERSALYARGGAVFNLQRRAWDLELGPGIEHRFTPNVGIFTEALLFKRLDDGSQAAVGRAGIRFSF
jgi:hypothetical protein